MATNNIDITAQSGITIPIERVAEIFGDASAEFYNKLQHQRATPKQLADARGFASDFFQIVSIHLAREFAKNVTPAQLEVMRKAMGE